MPQDKKLKRKAGYKKDKDKVEKSMVDIDTLLEKATEGDKRRILSQAVEAEYSVKYENESYIKYYAYLCDYDDEYVYWDLYVDNEYKLYKSSYTYNGTQAELSDQAVEVVHTTEYLEVVGGDVSSKKVDESLGLPFVAYADVDKSVDKIDKMYQWFEKNFGGSQKEQVILKQFDEDEMIAIEPLYVAINDVDAVGDTYASPEVCYDMVDSFNKAIADGKMKGNYFHKLDTDDFTILKAWVNEVEAVIGESVVKEGMPLVKIQFNNEKAWELRKSGELRGVSIGAKATWEEVE